MLRKLKRSLGSKPKLPRSKPALAVSSQLDTEKIKAACGVLLLNGLQCEGLFRAAGNEKQVQEIYGKFMTTDVEFSLLDHCAHGVELAYALRQYLLKLKEPLCPFNLYEEFLLLARDYENEEAFTAAVVPLLRQLREQRIKSMKIVFRTLSRLCREVECQDLSPVDCAIALGAGILRPREFGPSYVTNVKLQCQVVTAMVNFYDSWGSSVRKGQDTPAQDEEPSKAPNSALVAEVEALLVDGPDLSDADDADEEEPEFERVKMGPKLRLGSACPMFRAADSKGISFNVEDTFRRGRKLLIFFYPKASHGGLLHRCVDERFYAILTAAAFTPICTIQNKTFRDNIELFRYANVEVVGVSSDSVKCHERFVDAYKLPFRMISDPEGRVRKLFGLTEMLGVEARVTFVVNQSAVVEHIYSSMLKPKEHVLQSLEIISQLLEEEVTALPSVLQGQPGSHRWTETPPALPPRRA